jgi:hypothetical protein
LTFKHTAPHLASDKFEASSPESPFKGKSLAECAALLERLAEQTRDSVLHTVFAVFDERTKQDGSILLVQAVDDEIEGMRAVSELACAKLLCYMTGHGPLIVEDREDAEEEEDGVFRIHDEFLEIGEQDDGVLWQPVNTGVGEEDSAEEEGEEDVPGLTLHVPDPADFHPPHERREFLLDNGERVIVASRDAEKSWNNEIFTDGRSSARVVRELIGMEKSEFFRPTI